MTSFTVKIRSDRETADAVVDAWQSTAEVEILERRVDDDVQGADFALETVATVVALVSAVFVDGPIVPAIVAKLKGTKRKKITIETPLRSVEITSSENLSEEEVRGILRVLTQQ
jgi:hypothetical protein